MAYRVALTEEEMLLVLKALSMKLDFVSEELSIHKEYQKLHDQLELIYEERV